MIGPIKKYRATKAANGTILYKVAVAKDNVVHHVAVDSATGKITKAAVGEDGEHED